MRIKVLFASLVLCLSIVGVTRPGFAARVDREAPPSEPFAEMVKEGWKPVAEGVLQRDRGNGVIETFAFGTEGFTFAAQQLEGQLERMQREYAAHPSKKLARAIQRQKAGIARVQQTEKSGELASTFDAVIINGCDISYGAHANAYPLNGGGAGASSDAYLHNNCGYLSDVYSYAYARATVGGTITTQTTTDPRNGTWVDSTAVASVSGNVDCYSEASANVVSGSLGIFYSISAPPNYACTPPVPPVSVTITGPTLFLVSGYTCRTAIWTASVSGGAAPFTYTWYRDGYSVGSGSTYSETFCGSNFTFTEPVNLSVNVVDAISQSASDTHAASIRYSRTTTTCGMKICPEEPVDW